MPDNSAAFDWLKKNPDDPRAFSVMSKLANSGEFQLTPESKQAYDWAIANPSAPKTAEVKRKIIASGLIPMQRPEPSEAIGDRLLRYANDPMESIGTAPPIAERIPIVGPLIRKATHGAIAAGGAAFSDKPFGEELSKRYGELEEQSAKESKEFSEKHPIADVLFSGAASAALPVGGTLVKAGQGASALLRGGAKVADIAAKAGLQYGISRADVAARGGTEEEGKSSGETAAALTAGFEALPIVGKAAGGFVRRFMFGIPDKLAKKYYAGAARINKVDEEQLKDIVDNTVGKLRDAAEESKSALDFARGEARGAESMAKYNLSQVKPQRETVIDALDDIKDLRKSVSEQSSKAFDTLVDAPPADIRGTKSLVTTRMKELKIAGQVPTGQAGEGYKALSRHRKFLDQIAPKGSIDPIEVKKLIQNLDDDIGPIYDKMRSGQHVTQAEKSLIEMRRSLNEELLAHPAYAEAMAPLREDTKLLTALQDIIPHEQAGMRALGKAAMPEGARIKELFAKLEEKTGKKYLSEIEKQQWAIETRRNPEKIKAYLEQLPENARVKEVLKMADEAKAALAPVKGVTESGSQNLIRSIGNERGANLAKREQLKYIGEKAGQDVLQQAEDLGVKRALEGRAMTPGGSRNVNIAAFSLFGLGKALSEFAGNVGLPLGSVIGSIADISGPTTWKKMADLSMNPKFQKYSNMLGEAAKRGPQALMQRHNELMERDRIYRDAMK